MYLRPASWAQATASSRLWRPRTLASLISIGRFSPSNLAISVMEQTKAEVIAGLNLPMLIKLASVRGRQSLEDAVACAQEAGRKYISVASYVLAGEK